MLFKRLASAALATAVGLGTAGFALAEDVSVSSEDLSALIQRLEAAEKKIQELETAKAPLVPAEFDIPASIAAGNQPVYRRASSSSLADEDDPILKRLSTLENNWVDMEKSISERASDGSSNSNMTVFGRIHLDHWAFPGDSAGVNTLEGTNPQDRFAFRRVRIGVKGDIKDNVEYKIEMEFANPNGPEYRDVYIGMKDLPGFGTVLVGNQKRPYSLDQLNSSNSNVFIERPYIADATQQDTRRIGIQAYNISDDQAWNWRYGVFNRKNTQSSGSYISDSYQLEVAGRLANTWYYDECSDGRSYGHWAVAAAYGRPDGNGGPEANTARLQARPEARSSNKWLDTGAIAGASNYYLIGGEGVFNAGPLQLVSEVMGVAVDRSSASTANFWGGYGYASYFFTGEHIPWDRKTGTLGKVKPFQNFWMVDTCDDCTEAGWGAWQAAVRYSYADFNDDVILGGIGESVTLGLNWWWNPTTRVQFNYIHGRIDNSTRGGVVANSSGEYDILGTRLMVFF
ncbi:MAG: porin [Rhodopirellula sp.]|nr:porin [Rhodopirellula sp.]